MTPLLAPDLGMPDDEPVHVGCWLVKPGDEVVEGDRVVELWVGEITFDVSSPVSGRLRRVVKDTDEIVCAGAVLAVIEESDEDRSEF
jgi:pyruvate/2-oxoglutarate dehydrogenase complex dihydrolipoamide acyltransferase (E2) component